jgi:DASS family divalent anion:Na+ symporter
VLFASGYVEVTDWWKLGAVVSVVNISIWLLIGGAWWKLLGYW